MKTAICTMIISTLCVMKQSLCLNFIDVPSPSTPMNRRAFRGQRAYRGEHLLQRIYPPLKSTTDSSDYKFRRNVIDKIKREGEGEHNDKDVDIKIKISTLVDQTLHDTDRRIKSIEKIKKMHRDEAPYKAGFILSMIKKARDVLNELFNVAVHHKDEWRALEQLKIFELIVHTNVDTTNLVRQLVEIHIQYLNSTSTHTGTEEEASGRKRVVLLK